MVTQARLLFHSRITMLVLACLFVARSSASAADLAQSVTVRRVDVEIREVFDEPGVGWLYRQINQLKFSTHEEVVRRELLLRPGDRYEHFLLEESARALRALPFLRQVSITPTFEGNFVDLLVSVQDVWTLYPALAFNSGGGTQQQSVSLIETNLFGWGKRLELLYAQDEGRQKVEGIWDDRRLFGTKQRLLLGRFERSDGYRSVTYYGKPYENLSDVSSSSANSDFFNLVGRLFENGDESFIFRQKHQSASGRVSVATGDPEVLVNRYSFGYDYTRDRFHMPTPDDFEDADVDPASVSQDPSLLAENRAFSGPYFGFEQVEPDFISLDYIDRFDRVEDFNLGSEYLARVQAAPHALGSDWDALLVSFNYSDGTSFSRDRFLRGECGGGTRGYEQGLQNTMLHGEVIYADRIGTDMAIPGYHTFLSSLSIDIGERLDKDRQYLLGAASGLRGYEDRAFSGNQRIIFNLEDRVHIAEDVFRLISVGGVMFFDAGATSNNNITDALNEELHSDIGIGLRFGFPRASGGGVVRVDLALPLRGEDDTDAFQPRLLISTGQVFNARLRSESLGPERADISIYPGS